MRPGVSLLVLLALLFTTASCSRAPAAPSPTTMTPAPSPVPAPTAPAPTGPDSRWTGACADIVRRMRATLATLPSPCTADTDCESYTGGIQDVTGCGGASDRATAARVRALQNEYSAAQCGWGVSCAARQVHLACVAGHCAEQ